MEQLNLKGCGCGKPKPTPPPQPIKTDNECCFGMTVTTKPN